MQEEYWWTFLYFNFFTSADAHYMTYQNYQTRNHNDESYLELHRQMETYEQKNKTTQSKSLIIHGVGTYMCFVFNLGYFQLVDHVITVYKVTSKH